MSDEPAVNFEEFRRRIEGKAGEYTGTFGFDLYKIKDTCRWVSKSGTFCFAWKPKDIEKLLSFFKENPDVRDFDSFPKTLCDEAFCTLHAAAAKPLCERHKYPNLGEYAVTKEPDTGEDAPIRNPRQMLVLGSDDMIHCTFHDWTKVPNYGQPILNKLKRVATLPLAETGEEVPDASVQIAHSTDAGKSNENVEQRSVEALVNTNGSQDDVGEDRHESTKEEHKSEEDNDRADMSSTPPFESPSQQVASPRADMVSRTRCGDPSSDQTVQSVEEAVVRKLHKSLNLNDRHLGYVYALRDPELGLVKIGSTMQNISTRLGRLQSACKPGMGLSIVATNGNRPLFEYKRLERLVQTDLQPHRWSFQCPCGQKRRRHREWFMVSDDVATQTLAMWAEFIANNPYGVPRLSPPLGMYTLQQHWTNKLKSRPLPTFSESHEDHSTRIQRWKQLLASPTAPGHVTSTVVDARTIRIQRHEASPRETATADQMAREPVQPRYRGIGRPIQVRLPPGVAGRGHQRAASAAPTLERVSNTGKDAVVESKLEVSHVPADNVERGAPTNSLLTPRRPLSSGMGAVPSSTSFTFTSEIHTTRHVPQAEDKRTFSDSFLEPPSVEVGMVQHFTSTPSQPIEPSPQAKQPDPTSEGEADFQHAKRVVPKVQSLIRAIERELPTQVRDDLFQFRWQLAYAFTFGIFACHAPAGLSIVTWCIFLPVFVAELRGWSFESSITA